MFYVCIFTVTSDNDRKVITMAVQVAELNGGY